MTRTGSFWLAAVLCGVLGGTGAAEPPAVEMDFSSAPPELKVARGGRIENGVLELNAQPGGFIRATLPVAIDRPCRISFRVREVEVPQKSGHWGIVVTGEEASGQFYSRGKGLELLLGGKAKGLSGHGSSIVLQKGPDAAWTTLEITIRPDKVLMAFAGQGVGGRDVALLPLKEIVFYAFNNHVEIDDFRIQPLAEEELAETPAKQVFHASFDAGTTAEGADGRQIAASVTGDAGKRSGVSGEALELAPAGAPPAGPVKYALSQRAAGGMLFFDGLKGMSTLKLPVPELGDFTMKLRFRRLAVDPRDQHFGFHFSGGEGQNIHIFARGPIWTCIENDGERRSHHDYPLKTALPAAGADSPWVECMVVRRDGKLTLSAGGETITPDDAAFPIRQISIYAYHLDVAMDDWSIEAPGFQFRETFDTDFRVGGGKTQVSWPVEGVFDGSGALMFWFSPNWDAISDSVTRELLKTVNGNGKEKLSLFLWHWLRCDIGRQGEGAPVAIERRNRDNWFRHDWIHLAVVWNTDGTVRLFVNGLPYLSSYSWMPDSKLVPGHDLSAAVKMLLNEKANGTFDELKIFNGKVPNQVVYDEYRKVMPVDLVIRNAAVMPDRDATISVRLAPGGWYMRPMPVEQPFQQAEVDFRMELTDAAGTPIDAVERRIAVKDAPIDVALPVRKLPEGEYRVRCTVNGNFQRTFLFRSMAPLPDPAAGAGELKTGRVIFEKKLRDPADSDLFKSGPVTAAGGGTYLEAGPDKEDRFAFVIPIPEEFRNRGPMLLEIDWPDDKPRNMGLYLYRESKNAQHRDRMQGGVQAGNEYPSSGRIVTTSYLFNPHVAAYLFEARTMSKGFPAAVSAVRLKEIPGGLPKLTVRQPKGVPGRAFGHVDEDQTLETSLTADDPTIPGLFRLKYQAEALLRYFDYTGQNAFHYPLLRYAAYFLYPREGSADNGVIAGGIGEFPWFIEAFRRRGKTVTGILATTNIPEGGKSPLVDTAIAGRGMLMADKDGAPVRVFGDPGPLANFAHPEVRKLYFAHVRELLEVPGRCEGLDGFDQWLLRYGAWPSLNAGYDDYTVGAFSRDTGIAVPESGRFEFLTGPKRTEWLKWRAAQVTNFVRELRAQLNAVDPDLKLYVTAIDFESDNDPYVEHGIELDALRRIPGVLLGPSRNVTAYRHAMHWGKPESGVDGRLYDAALQRKLFGSGSLDFSESSPSYFETFTKSLDNDRFAAYFENADVKPHGRFFLKELVFSVAAQDAQKVLIGAQPLGTWGRDSEAREFARAFCALPRLPFRTVPGGTDPVAVRFLQTEEGTYFYLASMLFTGCEVELTFSDGTPECIDLSTGQAWKEKRVALQPFQLRSFLIPGKKCTVSSFRVTVPEECRRFYAGRLAELEKAAATLRRNQVEVVAEAAVLAELKKAVEEERFAEAHRLAFLPVMNQLGAKLADLEKVVRQSEMLRRNEIAIDCGGTAFTLTPEGKLFFPDSPWSDTARYGYFGHYNSVARNTVDLRDAAAAEVFKTEAYDIDGYRFRVDNGRYKVRLYLRIGYEPGFAAGKFVFSVAAQGKPLFTDLDLFEACDGDRGKVLIREFDGIEVSDGILTLAFKQKDGLHSNVRLCNAIEVIPEKR